MHVDLRARGHITASAGLSSVAKDRVVSISIASDGLGTLTQVQALGRR